jgi:hypothetical protein
VFLKFRTVFNSKEKKNEFQLKFDSFTFVFFLFLFSVWSKQNNQKSTRNERQFDVQKKKKVANQE